MGRKIVMEAAEPEEVFEESPEGEESFEQPMLPPPNFRQAISEETQQGVETHAPLFLEAVRNTKKVIDKLKVWSITPTGEVFKGEAPPWCDEKYLATRWGNGEFKVDAFNGNGRLIRSRNVTIGLEAAPGPSSGNGAGSGDPAFAHAAMQTQHDAHKQEVERLEKLAQRVNEQVTVQGKEYINLITATHSSTMARDKEFYKTQQQQSQEFYANMLAQTQQMAQQNMMMMQQSSQQAMQSQQFMMAQLMAANDPSKMVSLLQMGANLAMGAEPEDEPAWVKAVAHGVDGLKSLVQLKADSIPMKQRMPMMPGVPAPQGLPVKGNPSSPPSAASSSGGIAEKIGMSEEEKKAVADLLLLCDRKGVDIAKLAEQAKAAISDLPDATEGPGDEDDEDGDEDSDESETDGLPDAARSGTANVDGEVNHVERGPAESSVGPS